MAALQASSRFEWIEANVKKHDRIFDHLAETKFETVNIEEISDNLAHERIALVSFVTKPSEQASEQKKIVVRVFLLFDLVGNVRRTSFWTVTSYGVRSKDSQTFSGSREKKCGDSPMKNF